jgi:hypothetical protein
MATGFSPEAAGGKRAPAGNSRNKGGFLYNMAFHLFLESVYSDKDAQEWIIRKSTLEWVIARPVILTNGDQCGARCPDLPEAL